MTALHGLWAAAHALPWHLAALAALAATYALLPKDH